MRVLSVVGNRPQFIKSAPLSVALRDAGIEEAVLHTGQHWDPELSQVFFDELGLDPPRYRLDLRTADIVAMEGAIREVVEAEQPDWVLVFGDTNSTTAGARAAAGVPVAHVEAGLRSFDLEMPEERNRIEVDRLAALLLCPDERSAAQLAAEGVAGRRVVVGDVMADSARLFAPIAQTQSPALEGFGVEPGSYAVVTIHREANVTRPERLRRIVQGLRRIDVPLVFPAHPRTWAHRRHLDRADPPATPVHEHFARLRLIELLTGTHPCYLPGPLRLPKRHSRDYAEFIFTLPEPMAGFLHQRASSLLSHAGINEPVTWEPPFSWVTGITWPGPHPGDISPNHGTSP